VTASGSPVDVVVPAGPDDVAGFLPVSLRLLLRWVTPLGAVHVVTPDAEVARAALAANDERLLHRVGVVTDDGCWPEVGVLTPWFRQQYIKLHVDRVATGPRVLVVGADTLVLGPVDISGLLDAEGRPELRFFRYTRPSDHLVFERERVRQVAALLGTTPARSLVPGDFVCDLFLFEVAVLRSLRARFATRGGLLELLSRLGARQGYDNRFGEWTAYAVHALDGIADPVSLRLADPAFFGQVHSRWDLTNPDRYASRVVHFAWKADGPERLLADLRASGRLLGDAG
jgi:hypothetical protein